MRKNIYDDRYTMFTENEYYKCFFHNDLPKNIHEVLIKYNLIINNINDGKLYAIDPSMNSEMQTIYDFLIPFMNDHFYLSNNDILNSYLYAVMNQETEIKETIEKIIVSKDFGTHTQMIKKYGEDVVNYIITHKNYSHTYNQDSIFHDDKSFHLLVEDGGIQEIHLNEEKTKIKKPLK